jgi:electron transfer flavoprotein beta subunit
MKIAVCIKQVVTREWQLRVSEAGTWIRDSDASFELNEPDAYALEEALRLKEKHGGEVVVCSAGPSRASQVIREALARGADRAIHVESDALVAADAFTVADAIASAIRDEKFDLVLTGLQSDDQGFGQVGVVLAEKLGMPHATIIMEVQVAPSTSSGQASLRVKRELEGGWFQWMTLPLPALLTIQSGINQLRYATLKGIMAAKKKEIRKVTPQAGVEATARIHRVYFPEKGKKTQMIAGSASDAAKELVKKLRDDARVI